MRRLAVYFAFSCLAMIFGCAQLANATDFERQTIYIQCEKLNKHIWITGLSPQEVEALRNNQQLQIKMHRSWVAFDLETESTVQVINVNIRSSATEVYINSIPMKTDINAVVDRAGKVVMGGFIRDFDE